jgi:hypothetical protein
MPEQRDYADSFMALPDGMYFLASVGGELVGGTAVYRDRTRYAVALVDAVLHPDYRESAQTQLLKSSLPFFRTVVIREVDVLIRSEDNARSLPFPMASEIASWYAGTLKALGFREVTKALRCSIRVREDSHIASALPCDKMPNLKGAQNLYWKQNEFSRLDCSQVVLALDVAETRGSLRTWTTNETTSLALGIDHFRDRAAVWPLLADIDTISAGSIAVEIAAQVSPLKPTTIELPLLGLGQTDIARAVAEIFGDILEVREATLMRRKL